MKALVNVFIILLMAIGLLSCTGHSEIGIEQFSYHNTRMDSSEDHQSSEENIGGIILDISDTAMDEETETLIFHSQDWDEVERDVDL